jgi:hypothetical protein
MHQPALCVRKGRHLDGNLGSLLRENPFRLERRRQATALLVAMNLAEPSKRLESEPEAGHG